jgi:hypothetical protein
VGPVDFPGDESYNPAVAGVLMRHAMSTARLLPVLPAAVLLACSPAIRTPEVRFTSFSARSADETVVGLAIYNPNHVSLRVLSVDYEVSAGGKPCGGGRRDEPLVLAARDTTEAEFSLSPDWGAVVGAIPALLADSVVFGVKGKYAVATAFGQRRFGFEGSRTVSVKDEVRSVIEDLFEEP